MKSIVKGIALAAAMYVAGATAAMLPQVGDGTEPNQWTRNMAGVLEAAKTTQLPILLVMVNESSTGEGCDHCKQFSNNTLNSAEFASICQRYRFYMVLLNKWNAPSYGGVTSEVWSRYFWQYQSGDQTYPQVVIVTPDGKRYTGWSFNSRPVSAVSALLYQYGEAFSHGREKEIHALLLQRQ